MVGVPRSKGCLACLRRRVKCDETRPECQCCRRRGLPCPGYARDRKFYYHFSVNRQPEHMKAISLKFQSPPGYVHRELLPLTSINEIPFPDLVGTALDQQCREGFCMFVDSIFPGIYYGYSTRVGVNWFDVARGQQYVAGEAIDWAVRTIGIWQLGKAQGDQRQVIASREMNSVLVGTDATLGAAILLGIYEVVNATDQESWLLHSRGISHLFRLRGPKQHASGFGRTLLLSFRGYLVFEAFIRSEACFLESEEWRAILSETLQDERRRGTSCQLSELIEYAFNEIAQCPGYFMKAKAVVSSVKTTAIERENLIHALRRSRNILLNLESEILAGIKAHALSDENKTDFSGSIPVSIAEVLAKFSFEGIRSANALVQQLMGAMPWIMPAINTTGVIRDPYLMAQMAQIKTRLHPTGPQRPEPLGLWPDRIAMAME
ncbi:hypothetical protein BDW75DRAFT_235725 [Aspergillus navahoensis]